MGRKFLLTLLLVLVAVTVCSFRTIMISVTVMRQTHLSTLCMLSRCLGPKSERAQYHLHCSDVQKDLSHLGQVEAANTTTSSSRCTSRRHVRFEDIG
jgi:hypothetical protein